MDQYRYVLALGREDGSRLATVPLEPDFGPYVEWTHFHGIRAGKLPPSTACPTATVAPLWRDERERGGIRGLRVSLPAGGAIMVQDFPSSVFLSTAAEAAAPFYRDGSLRADEGFRYRVCAYPQLGLPSCTRGFRIEAVDELLPLVPADLRSDLAGGIVCHEEFADEADFRVLIAPSVIAAARELAARTPDVESGGVLVGRLHRDTDSADLFLAITGLIPARHAVAEAARFTFTPETWSAARDALALRGRGEGVYGWAHHHPFFCRLRGCPAESRRHCALSSAFFSREDVHLHRAVFPRAYNVALLVHEARDGALDASLYGWRGGLVERRAYALTGGEGR